MANFEDLNAEQLVTWDNLNARWTIETWRTTKVGNGFAAYVIVADGDEARINTDGTAEWTTGEHEGEDADA